MSLYESEKDRLIRQLQKEIRRKNQEIANLENKIRELKNALYKQTIGFEADFNKIKNKFSVLDNKLIDTVIMLVKSRREPVHYTLITKVAKARFPMIRKFKDESIRRRLQYLGQQGILHRPRPGYYVIGEIYNTT